LKKTHFFYRTPYHRIGNLPYSKEQIIANTVGILLQANIFPLKEFGTWDAVTLKSYPTLKTFIHAAYGRRLTALVLRSTSGQNGYANQTMYNILEDGNDDDTNDNMVTTIMQTDAGATGGETPSGGTAISAKVAAAINQLSANQTAIMSQMAAVTAQMAALSVVPPPAQNTRAYAPAISSMSRPFNKLLSQCSSHFQPRGLTPQDGKVSVEVAVATQVGAEAAAAARHLRMQCKAQEPPR
jgi:hypothetical protein